eukprot:161458_1
MLVKKKIQVFTCKENPIPNNKKKKWKLTNLIDSPGYAINAISMLKSDNTVFHKLCVQVFGSFLPVVALYAPVFDGLFVTVFGILIVYVQQVPFVMGICSSIR